MERFSTAIETFAHAMERARQMISLFDALTAIRPADPANDDALRAAYFQAVSSFDFFAHEIAAIEARHRFANGIATQNIRLPMDILTSQDIDVRITNADTHIRLTNSYKAFVDPAKLAELLSCYCDNPWKIISDGINTTHSPGKNAEDLKAQLKSIWKRRNQIAHEADINPTLAGITLWPIDKADAEITIAFLIQIAEQLPATIATPLP
ncbi:HEPN domain-containing protein [Xanthomonas sp. LF06-19]|uniref:HEPN domain-containing protein n=1 Tax=Xanthomonas sp. LF06-19 TaxID=3097551 RepID=UPI0025DF1BD7|nr:HEPN domain-containing protein [Xanthomonas sp. LF06-19]MDY4284894.1 HEPN domain-containing protein [Xanthomonas sp. LF06-19]